MTSNKKYSLLSAFCAFLGLIIVFYCFSAVPTSAVLASTSVNLIPKLILSTGVRTSTLSVTVPSPSAVAVKVPVTPTIGGSAVLALPSVNLVPKPIPSTGMPTSIKPPVVAPTPANVAATAVWVSPPGNLIPNPSLSKATISSSSPDYWLQGGYGTSTRTYAYPVAGPFPRSVAVKVSISNYVSGDAKWYFTNVPIHANAVYSFSDWYNSTSTSLIVADFTLTDGSQTYPTIATLSPTSRWTSTTQRIVTPANASSVTIFHLIQSNGSLATTDFALLATPTQGTFPQGMVTLTFDDGWKSQYTNALPILSHAQIPGTFYIISNAMLDAGLGAINQEDTADTYMNTSQVKALQTAGEEIGAHTMDHCDLVMLENDPSSAMRGGDQGPPFGACASQLPASSTPQQQINGSRSALRGAGFSPVDTFAYPYGSFDANIENMLRSDGFIGSRTVLPGYNPRTVDPYALYTQIVNESTTFDPTGLSQVESWINTASSTKQWLVLTFHNVEPANILRQNGDVDGTTPEFLQSIVNYLKANNICVVTTHMGLQAVINSSTNPCSK